MKTQYSHEKSLVQGVFVVLLALTPCTAVAQQAVPRRGALPAQQAGWKPLLHNLPPELQQWKRLGARLPGEHQSVTVALKLPNPAALEAFVESVNDPASPDYHKFLTAPGFTRRFAPSQDAVDRVKKHLTAFGLKITQVLPNHLCVQAEGTTAQIQKAFATTIAIYQNGNQRLFSNETAPSLPATVAEVVDDIYGLDNAPRMKPMYQTSPPPTLPYNANHLRTAYNLNPFYAQRFRGAGKTIAIYSLFSTTTSDTTRYIKDWIKTMPSTPATYSANITYINIDGGPTGGNLEADLDLQQVLSTAPDAAIRVYQAPNTGQGGFDAVARIVSDNSADIVTESYGLAEAKATSSQHTQLVTAGSQGITYFASSGDFGSTQNTGTASAPSYTLAVAFPASDPNVVAVGGTNVTLDGAFAITNEVGWNGSGGGISTKYTAPTWQANTSNGQNVFLGIANPNNGRLVPDVSSHATGCLTYTGGSNSNVFGTSASTPFWAGAMALMENYIDSIDGVSREGNINNRWYLIASSGEFRDITTGNNRQTGTGTSYDCKAGYDLVTGWGSANFYALAQRLAESFLYVDKSFTGVEQGTRTNPYRTVLSAVNAASATNRTGIYIRDNRYNERFITKKRITFYNWYNVNTVHIGSP